MQYETPKIVEANIRMEASPELEARLDALFEGEDDLPAPEPKSETKIDWSRPLAVTSYGDDDNTAKLISRDYIVDGKAYYLVQLTHYKLGSHCYPYNLDGTPKESYYPRIGNKSLVKSGYIIAIAEMVDGKMVMKFSVNTELVPMRDTPYKENDPEWLNIKARFGKCLDGEIEFPISLKIEYVDTRSIA